MVMCRRNCPPLPWIKDGLARTVYRAALAPASYYIHAVIDLGLDKEGTFCPTHQHLEGHLKK